MTVRNESLRASATTVVVVDDEVRFLDVLRPVLEADGTFLVVGRATSAGDAFGVVARLNPDVLVIDVHMPGRDGFETARVLHTAFPAVAIVLTSGLGEAGYADLSRQVGARGFLPKRRLSATALRELLADEAAATP